MEGKLGELWLPEVGADVAPLAAAVVAAERALCSTLHRTLGCIPEIKSIDEYPPRNWGTQRSEICDWTTYDRSLMIAY